MKDFLVMYNFALFGILFLSTIMGYEGNYIDGLMSRKESIYSLLQAKYAIYSIGQVIPLVMIIPAIIMGKVTLLTAISWFFFIPGFPTLTGKFLRPIRSVFQKDQFAGANHGI